MAELTIKEFLTKLNAAFIPEKAAGVDASIQLKLTGAQAGDWYVTIKDGKCTTGEGAVATPKLTVSVDGDDFMKIFSGKMDGMQAFMQGKLRLTGDMSLAMKMLGLFKTS
jgi:putative sterol carrier protein